MTNMGMFFFAQILVDLLMVIHQAITMTSLPE